MNNATKSRLTSSTFAETTSTSTQNTRSFQHIVHRQSPSLVTSRNEPTYIIVNTIDNDHTNDPLTRSILIDSAAQKRGFLPFDYRALNTFETIRRQRAHYKKSSKYPVIPSPTPRRASTRFDAFGNSTSKMSKLAEQRLILRDKCNKKQRNLAPVVDTYEKPPHSLSDADFATDIPNALELLLKMTTRKTIMERHLLEITNRERSKQARYRLLPINRAPYG